MIFDTAPVAAEKRLLAYKVERPGDGRAVTLGQYQYHVVAQGLLSDIEKFAGQVGRAPFAAACILIELPEGVPMFGFDLIACEATDGSAKVLRLGALAADVLALACGQGCEEVCKGFKTVVFPMKLLRGPAQKAHGGACYRFIFCAEGHMQRTDALLCGDLDRALDEGGHGNRFKALACEEARACGRREGHGDLELWVILPTCAGEGIGPVEIKDIFALRV